MKKIPPHKAKSAEDRAKADPQKARDPNKAMDAGPVACSHGDTRRSGEARNRLRPH